MPIEIKELIIKLSVSDRQTAKKNTTNEISSVVKNKIVKECVEKVLEKLESKIER